MEWVELDCRLDAAWLARVSDVAPDVAKQVPDRDRTPKADRGTSTSVSTGSPTPADPRVSPRIEWEELDSRLDAAWAAQVSDAAPDGLFVKQMAGADRGSAPEADRGSTIRPREWEELDCRLDAAWLPQVSDAAPAALVAQVPKQDRGRTSVATSSLMTPAECRRLEAAWLAAARDALVAKQVPKEDRGSRGVSTGLLTSADRPVGPEVSYAPGRNSGPVKMVLVGLLFAVALAAGIAIPHLSRFQSLRPPIGGPTLESPEPLTSTTAEVRNKPGPPKLIVGPLVGVAGQPVPIGLGLAEQTSDAVVVIRGLLPGMELSKGDPVDPATWQLTASDLRYAWITPPRNFIGSADLVAELRLPNAQIADRQTIRVKWMARGIGDESNQGQNTRKQELDASRPVDPTTVQHPNDREVITAAPPVSANSSQNQLARQEGKNTRARGKNSLRRSLEQGSRRAPFETRRIGDSTQAVKGFWDWSR
jgi:hypothetical protein